MSGITKRIGVRTPPLWWGLLLWPQFRLVSASPIACACNMAPEDRVICNGHERTGESNLSDVLDLRHTRKQLRTSIQGKRSKASRADHATAACVLA